MRAFSGLASETKPIRVARVIESLVRPFRSRDYRNKRFSISDIADCLDTFNNKPVDALGIRFQKLSRDLDNSHNVVPAWNDVNLFDLCKLEQCVSNLRLLAQDRSNVDESANMPLHLTLWMIVSFDQFQMSLKPRLWRLHITPWTKRTNHSRARAPIRRPRLETGSAQLRAKPSAGLGEMIRLPLTDQ